MEYDEVTDNKKLNVQNTQEVYEKAGKYILNMGYVNFLESLIINLILILHVDRKQRAIVSSGR